MGYSLLADIRHYEARVQSASGEALSGIISVHKVSICISVKNNGADENQQ